MGDLKGFTDFIGMLVNYRLLLLIIGCVIWGQIGVVRAGPSQYCVEQTKDRRLVGVEPYAIDTTKDLRQCIARCIRDNREIYIHCKSVVYSKKSRRCEKFQTTAREASAGFEKTHETDQTAYYELLVECPHRATVDELADEKRRDDAGMDPRRPLADPYYHQHHETGPPSVAPAMDVDPLHYDSHHNTPPYIGGQPGGAFYQEPPPPTSGKASPAPSMSPTAQLAQSSPPTPAAAAAGAPPMAGSAPPQQLYAQPETYQVRSLGPVASCCSPPVQTSCCVNIVMQPASCCPAPQPQPCCPAPQPQPCCPAPQPQPCCPAPQPAPCCPPPPMWGPWSSWSNCHQVPCAPGGGGDTYQTRVRQCMGYGCSGEPQQQQPCGCLQGQWTEWGPPSSCSVTCGQGLQTRTRSCTVPGTCPGKDTDQATCDKGPCCHWSEWNKPEPCPQTCGHTGMTVRRRQCVDVANSKPTSGCPGVDSDPLPCPEQLPPCCQPWSAWSGCSATCGEGVCTRTRACDSGPPSTEQKPCTNPQPCCTEWTQWSGCHVVCGQGYQSRTRSCGANVVGGSGGGAYLGPSTLGLPTLPVQSQQGGCCLQQQPCSNGCSPNNAFYVQSGGSYRAGRKRRSKIDHSE